MNLLSGYPYWLVKNGLLFQYPALTESIKTDVAIIGGGISGALMGYYLANAGIECTIADGRTIGLGSTCASTSLLQYEIDIPLSKLQKIIGPQDAVKAYKLCEQSIYKLKEICSKIKFKDFELKHSLYYANSSKGMKMLQSEFEARKGNGFDVNLLDKEELQNTFGIDAPGAILSTIAAQTDAYKLTHALHQYSQKKGVKIFDRTPITTIQHNANSVILQTENGYSIVADKLIYATGYEAVKYVDKKIVSLHTTYATVSEQLTQTTDLWKDEALIWNTALPYLYMRTTPDKRIIVGGRDDTFTGQSSFAIDKKTSLLIKDFNGVFPEIKFKPEFNWCGIFGSTKDGLPYIGPYKKLPNSYFALGFGGNGITFSLIAAEIITDVIKNGKCINAPLFSFER